MISLFFLACFFGLNLPTWDVSFGILSLVVTSSKYKVPETPIKAEVAVSVVVMHCVVVEV